MRRVLCSVAIMDGQQSIEYQIDIHVRDLVEAQHNPELGMKEVLMGLEYVLAYRLKTTSAYNLHAELAGRLVNGILLVTGQREGGFFGRKLTEEAGLGLRLLREYAEAVESVRRVLEEMPRDELDGKLRLGLYLEDERFHTEALELLRILQHSKSAHVYSKASTLDMLPLEVLHFDRSVERVLDMYQTDLTNGLKAEQRERYRKYYGRNELPKMKEKSVLGMLWGQMNDFMFWLLLVSAIISAIMDFPDVTSAIVLLLVIVLNVGIGMKQELEASRTLSSLKALQIPHAKVVIQGNLQVTPSSELVPGDLVVLEEGDAVPADLRLVQVSRNLQVNEAMLTGEVEPVGKSTELIRVRSRRLQSSSCRGNVFMGTTVLRGNAKGVVVRIGQKTEMGQISTLLLKSSNSEHNVESELQKRLNILGKWLVAIAVGLCALVFIAGLIRRIEMRELIKVSISLAVSVIPEGLVAVLTLALANACKNLAKKKCLVKRLNVVETLGGVQVICSDKTGTLTLGKMQVERVWTSDGCIILQDGSVPSGLMSYEWCRRISLLCSTAEVTSEGRVIGDPTEVALLQYFSTPLFNRRILLENYKISAMTPFDSERKMMSTKVVVHQADECFNLVKGAPEMVLQKCIKYLLGAQECEIDDTFRGNFERIQEEMSREGLRCLALAYTYSIDSGESEEMMNHLVFVGLIGMIDPPREGVRDAVGECARMGIRVIMITGDHPTTALSIASKLDITSNNNSSSHRLIMRGTELDALTVDGLAEMEPFPLIFARVTPQHKLMIVQALRMKKSASVIAMTGDGVNDAPAIKSAHVGIAMGITGTDLAKDAASLILLDDNFCTILLGIQEGRRVRECIQRFLVYLLACNSGEIWMVLGAVVAGWPVPVSAVNVLWANVVADIPPSLALGMEPASNPVNEPGLLSVWDVGIILVDGLLIAGASLFAFQYELRIRSASLLHARSEAFFVLTSSQLFLVLTCKSIWKSTFQSILPVTLWMGVALVVSFGLLIVGHYAPGISAVLQLEPVAKGGWLGFLLTSLALLAINDVLKFFKRRSGKSTKNNKDS